MCRAPKKELRGVHDHLAPVSGPSAQRSRSGGWAPMVIPLLRSIVSLSASPGLLFRLCKDRDGVTKPGGWAGGPRGLFSLGSICMGEGPFHSPHLWLPRTNCCHGDRPGISPPHPRSALPIAAGRRRAPSLLSALLGGRGTEAPALGSRAGSGKPSPSLASTPGWSPHFPPAP